MDRLDKLALELRKDVARLIHKAGTGHIGGDFSVMEILVTLYFEVMDINKDDFPNPCRDRFVLSKGHCVEALYAVLARKGFIDWDDVFDGYGAFGSRFIGHPNNKIPGIEMNTGSLGHGLAIGVGMALASRMDDGRNRVYVVMGDGELDEGSVWEAAMAAASYRLGNLCAVIDRNRLQISGRTEDVMGLDPLDEKWKSFGWNVLACNGNSCEELSAAFLLASRCGTRPSVIIANTVKGYGASLMEDKASWHHKVPDEQELSLILDGLDRRMEGLS